MERAITYWSNPQVRRRKTGEEITLNLDNYFVVIDPRIDAVWRAACKPGTLEQLRDRTAELLQLDPVRAHVITRGALETLVASQFVLSVSEEYVALYDAEPWAQPNR